MPIEFRQTVKRGLFYKGDFVQGLWMEATDGNPYDKSDLSLASIK